MKKYFLLSLLFLTIASGTNLVGMEPEKITKYAPYMVEITRLLMDPSKNVGKANHVLIEGQNPLCYATQNAHTAAMESLWEALRNINLADEVSEDDSDLYSSF